MKNFQVDGADMDKIRQAWNMSEKSLATNVGKQRTGEWKKNVPYYAVKVNGVEFPGERPFEARWEQITQQFDFTGKRVLECGTNMGLFSTFLMRLGGAIAATGFEREEVIHNASKLFAEGIGVKPNFVRLTMDEKTPYEETLGADYNVALILSFFKYVKGKDRALRYFSQIPNLIYEGEPGQDQDNIEMFAKLGYKHKNMGPSERKRTVFHFYKG